MHKTCGSEYGYTRHDLIEKPITYEFSEYHGESGLADYESERDAIIERLKEKIDANTDILTLIEVISNSNPTQTEGMFTDILVSLLNKELKYEREIFIFIKKFEVAKRFWDEYDTDTFKRIGNDYTRPLPYLLFGNILIKYIPYADTVAKKLIAFNASLKVCDTLASTLKRFSTGVECSLALLAFENERWIYRQFKNREIIL